MLKINVALPNGHAEILTLLPSSTVQDVSTEAQRAFGKKYLRLITAKNQILVDPAKTLEEVEIQDGECLTALVLQPQLAATSSAFALWCHGDSATVTWGDADCGGDSSAVRNQLRGVLQIQASYGAFAAILEDGSVVTWGNAEAGGDSSAVQEQLRGVQQIQVTERAFAAILEDGSVLTWGGADYGGDTSAVRYQLKAVQQIQATFRAFAAILADGSVVTWGNAEAGGDSSAVQGQLRGVQQIQASYLAFAAILEDGSVVTWGEADCGGDSSAVGNQLRAVQQIQATLRAFAAILADGSVVTWGKADYGGDSSAVRDQLEGVQQIQATSCAFAAILEDGSVVTWGECTLWRWQFGRSRSAWGCAADSGHKLCICCHTGRWICRYLGECTLWRWQFGRSRSAQGCLVQLRAFARCSSETCQVGARLEENKSQYSLNWDTWSLDRFAIGLLLIKLSNQIAFVRFTRHTPPKKVTTRNLPWVICKSLDSWCRPIKIKIWVQNSSDSCSLFPWFWPCEKSRLLLTWLTGAY